MQPPRYERNGAVRLFVRSNSWLYEDAGSRTGHLPAKVSRAGTKEIILRAEMIEYYLPQEAASLYSLPAILPILRAVETKWIGCLDMGERD